MSQDTFLSLGFSIGHACPKSRRYCDVGDWIQFRIIESDEELIVFECPKCKVRACLSLEQTFANPKQKRHFIKQKGSHVTKTVRR